MERLRTVLGAALVALVAIAAVVAVLYARSGGGARVRGLTADARLGPTAALFGDRLQAEVRVVLDRRSVDEDSVVVATDFGALSAPAVAAPLRERAGDVVVLRYRYGLFCLRDECRARNEDRRITFPPAVVRYRLRDGRRDEARLGWPPLTLGTRLGAEPAGIADWRVRDDVPPVAYRVSPAALAAVGYALALVLALLGAALVVGTVVALVRRAPVDELAGLPPLERALRVLRLALANGSPPEHRRALDRLARELRRAGHRDLAGEARQLAWQRPGPDRNAADLLAGRVAATIGGAA